MIRRFSFWILGLLGLMVLTGFLAAIVLSRMDLRPQVERLVTARTGRPLTIDTLEIGWGNPIGLTLTGLHLANPTWGSTPDMVSIGSLRAAIALWPLLHGEVRLSKIVVERPVIVLERDDNGTGNWVFPAMRGKSSSQAGPVSAPSIPFVSDMRLVDGRLTFRTTERHLLRVQVGKADLTANNEQSPISLHAEGSYNDLPLTADVTLESFAALRQAPKPVATDVLATTAHAKLRFSGTMTDPIGVDGILGETSFDAASFEDFSDMLGMAMEGDQHGTVAGLLDKQGNRWRLTDVTGTIVTIPLTGALGLDEGKRGQPDHFDINLDLGPVDLKNLISHFSLNTSAVGSQTAIPLSVNETPGETYAIQLSVKTIAYGGFQLGDVGIEAKVDPGKVTVGKFSFGLADGRVNLSAVDETSGKGGHLQVDAELSRVRVEQIVATSGMGASMLAGKFDGRATLEMTGTTTEDGLRASRGQMVLAMADGQISREILRLASSDTRSLFHKGRGNVQVTCFLGVADMHNGIVSVAPLRLKTREGNLFGGGQVNLLSEALDLRLQSEGKSTHFWALDIPVAITGSLGHPKVKPMLRSDAGALEARGNVNLRALSPDLRQRMEGNRC